MEIKSPTKEMEYNQDVQSMLQAVDETGRETLIR